jgi:hypothetical protein
LLPQNMDARLNGGYGTHKLTLYSSTFTFDACGLIVIFYRSPGPGLRRRGDQAAALEMAEVEAVGAVTGRLSRLAGLRARGHARPRALPVVQVWQMPAVRATEAMISMAGMPPKSFAADLLADPAGGRTPVRLVPAEPGKDACPGRPRRNS